MLNQNI